MMLAHSLSTIALAACLTLPDTVGPPPQLERRWAEAMGLHLLHVASGYHGPRAEAVEMLDAVLTGKLGKNDGWYHPSRSRLDWAWVAARMDGNRDGRIERAEFCAAPDLFDRLDRDQDGVLTAADFDWSAPHADKKEKRDSKDKSEKKDRKGGMPSREVLLAGLVRGEIGSPYEGPRPGQPAPLFSLPTQDGGRTVSLADQLGRAPVVLIFGSFT